VVFDQEWCIGCGYCAEACPFDVPRLGHGEEKASAIKCRFCIDRVQNGLQPACAKACPTGAIEFGERNALIAQAKDRVDLLKARGFTDARLYGEKELGGLHQMYVLTEKASVFGLPESPKVATRNVVGSWLSGLVAAGVVAALPFWLLFKRKEALAAEEVSEGGE
jgi:formate dehydrogenase iron-sulfur subunit